MMLKNVCPNSKAETLSEIYVAMSESGICIDITGSKGIEEVQ
jgi:hypothetical protein